MIGADPIEIIAANSYRDFHARGIDYLCLHRSEALTVKAYFFEGVDPGASEAVNPHDHRYPFSTSIIAGRSEHFRYAEPRPSDAMPGDPFHCFDWLTPLNGGSGFAPAGEARLRRISRERYKPGDSYFCRADEIHTISVDRDAILLLVQLADVVPLDQPTRTFVPGWRDKAPPDTSGLYSRMTEDEAVARLKLLRRIMGDRDAL